MRILLSNDDGIQAPGLKVLAEALRDLGEIVVCAPASQQSGKGSSMTFTDCLKVDEIEFAPGIHGYGVYGTPRDSANIGILGIMKGDVDLVVTGINEGPNMCNDSVCSGTIGAASAAYNNSIPAIAVSLGFGENYDFTYSAQLAHDLAVWFMKQDFRKDFILSINVPNTPDIKGIVIADTGGKHVYGGHYQRQVREDGIYYQAIFPLADMRLENLVEDLDHDIYAFHNGYVVLTPVEDDLVRKNSLETLRKGWAERQ
ncbi:MAG: 5'/3'-nucleotidase SurE [Erysipelotrichaceae bacterium]|nr:5'/3'-nucleotidase SurE [Erysipelotrichaceae bacterium]